MCFTTFNTKGRGEVVVESDGDGRKWCREVVVESDGGGREGRE